MTTAMLQELISVTAPTCGKCRRPLAGRNALWESRGRGRGRRATCRACHNRRVLTARRKQREAAGGELQAISPDEYTALGGIAMGSTSANGKNAPWNLYKVRPEAQEIWQQFQIALDAIRTPCFNDPAYTEFDDPRFPDEPTGRPTPTPAEAKALCAGCPLRALCGDFARKEKPDWGVYGGKVYIAGIVQRDSPHW